MPENNAPNTARSTADATPEPPGPDDPRYGFAVVTDAVGKLLEATPADSLGNATPCPEFTVKELSEHIVLVMRRVAAIGRGEHWSTIQPEAQDAGWAESYREAAHQVMQAWTDAAKLEATYEVPWGEIPGTPLMYTYTAELATHGWDLATATGLDFSIDDDVLTAPLIAAKFIPAEGRDTPEMPFSAVVDPGLDAPVLEQLAGWMGRDVLATS